MCGDPHPTLAQWVETTRQRAVSSQSGDTVDSGSTPVYFVVLHGNFVDTKAYVPGGAAYPAGTVLSFTIDAANGQLLDLTLTKSDPDYSHTGEPQTFALG